MKLERESGDLLIKTARNGWIIHRHEGCGLSGIPWIDATRDYLAKCEEVERLREEVRLLHEENAGAAL